MVKTGVNVAADGERHIRLLVCLLLVFLFLKVSDYLINNVRLNHSVCLICSLICQHL
jgi:hypothetical protein